jgi:hypothetical protein
MLMLLPSACSVHFQSFSFLVSITLYFIVLKLNSLCCKNNAGPKCSLWEWIDLEPTFNVLKLQKELEDVKLEMQKTISNIECLRKDMDAKLYRVVILLIIFFVFYVVKKM